MFAITGGKGGCGKTTTALGLARALARQGAEPLVVDADVDMPDLHLLADVPPEPNASAIAEGAHVECAGHRPEAMPGVTVVPAGTADRTPAALRRLSSRRDPVLVDCPAGAGDDATLPLRHADGAILVTTTTPQSLTDAAKTADVAARLDAPVRGVLLRGPDAESTAPPVSCQTVHRVDTDWGGDPTDSTGEVLSDQEFAAAFERLSQVILDRSVESRPERTTGPI